MSHQRAMLGILVVMSALGAGCSGMNEAPLVQPTAGVPAPAPVPATPAGVLAIEPGEYDLTFTADACEALDASFLRHYTPVPLDATIPEALRTRRYTAMLSKVTGTRYALAPHSTATFSGFGFPLEVADHDVSFMDDMGFWETLSSFTYLEFDGHATATVDAASTASFEMSYSGYLTYCRLNSAMDPLKNCWNTPTEQVIERSFCGSQNHRLAFQHR